MPGHANSPFWAALDFESDGEEDTSPNNQRVYVDPWDNQAYGLPQGDQTGSIASDNINFVGEPVSASFYYVPTKNYDSEDEMSMRRNVTSPVVNIDPDYSAYTSRRKSNALLQDIHPDQVFNDGVIRDRRRPVYVEDAIYTPCPMIYDPLYGAPMLMPPHPGYQRPRSRMSLQHTDYGHVAINHGKRRRTSRMTDAYEYLPYDSLSPEYEDWARPYPKAAPENFHLSRYGHLQIDYSCSWNSLDRLIRNQ